MDDMISVQRPGIGSFDRERLNIARISDSGKQIVGYTVITQGIFNALMRNGVNVLDPYCYGWDWRLFIGTPVAWVTGPGDAVVDDLLVHTMFDADLLPPRWVKVLNRAGLIWVPSTWCRDVFVESGVERPMFVSGYGVDSSRFNYVPRGWIAGESQEAQNEKYTFLVQCGVYGDRKNEELVRRTFAKLNLPDARLIVKMRRAMGDQLVALDRDIEFVMGDLALDEWIDVLAKADCLISVSSGEGFSLVPLEGMAMGLPAVILDYGGPRDYINAGDTALTVRVGKMELADQYNAVFGGEARWALPDMDDLADKMLWCYRNREAAAIMGRRAAERVAEHYTWDVVVSQAIIEILKHTNNSRRLP